MIVFEQFFSDFLGISLIERSKVTNFALYYPMAFTHLNCEIWF